MERNGLPCRLPVVALIVAAASLMLSPVVSQAADATSTKGSERAAAARQAQADARTRPLIEAERTRPRLAGIWRAAGSPVALRTLEGREPPLNAAGRRLLRERVAARRAGRSDDPHDQCLPPGTPRILWQDAPFLITQAPAKVTVFHQHRHVIRHIWLDGPLVLADDIDPTWEGISSGRWEGDTLVIETGAFNGRQWLDAAGLPQSPGMKVTERLRLVQPGLIENQVTIEDAAYYARPWTTRVSFNRLPDDTDLPEEECSEKLLEFPLRGYAPE